MFELVLMSVVSIYFVALIFVYSFAHFFGIGCEQQLDQE